MAVVHVSPLRPMPPMRRVGRRKTTRLRSTTRRGPMDAAISRRAAERTHWLRTVVTAVRAAWVKMQRQLARSFTSRALASLAGVVRLVIDCVALGAVLLG